MNQPNNNKPVYLEQKPIYIGEEQDYSMLGVIVMLQQLRTMFHVTQNIKHLQEDLTQNYGCKCFNYKQVEEIGERVSHLIDTLEHVVTTLDAIEESKTYCVLPIQTRAVSSKLTRENYEGARKQLKMLTQTISKSSSEQDDIIEELYGLGE